MAYPYGEPLENKGDKKDEWDFKEFEGRDSCRFACKNDL